MSNPNAFGYGSGGETAVSSANLTGHKFSADELRVLAECNNESFYRRSMPIGTTFGLAAYAAVQQGYLRPNPRFGAVPKVTLAVVVGYFVGKLSYQQACAEKLMALPGSYVGQLLRERRDGKHSSQTGPRATQGGHMFGAGPGDIYSDAGPGSSLDLDTDRPVFNDNDTFRADRDADGAGGGGVAGSQPRDVLSYEELRRRNRGAFNDAKQDPYKVEPGSLPPLSRAPAARAPQPPSAPTNKYGDDME